ncbi:LysR family transcriptional regulator [Proteus myxofaciens]|uniref:LysR family transcriptional regulator n=1 Tax=Proteus myxofaciens ATCC 19692 TaxID=1354337 RepID=A0A198FE84_9GAMM|nr:LysR family transcriptional regulator [Proteus myxofaciens]OAT22581.1 LysR family transcriptional regulator [Proteus myxofaciens ATCC 19692]
MNLNDVHLFLVITETNSLAQAARRLDISPMAVSRRLTSLEQELGTRLMQRTTRSVSLTQEGSEFLPYARSLIETEKGAKSLFSSDTKGVSGLLRVTAPSGFGQRYILPLVPSLLNNNPGLRINLQLTEDVVDIVGQGIDVAIRVAPLRDSSLIARKLSDNPRIVCASPDYLRKFGTPEVLHDLSFHNCLRLANVIQWSFESLGHITSMTVDGRFSSSSVEGVRELCIQGMGLAQLTLWDVKKEIAEGKLVEVSLSDVLPQYLSIWALLPTNQYIPMRVNAFIENLKSSLG